MSKNIYTEFQIKELEKNPNIISASERSISYNPEFKTKAVKEYKKGKSPSQIFIEHGFNLEIIGKEKPKRCLQRWRDTFERFGEEGFLTERRGKGSTGRPTSKPQSVEDQLRKAEARIKFLEAENGLPKKAGRARKAGSEKEMILTAVEKFYLIERTIRIHQLKKAVSYLCKLAGVSRSGYYDWLKAAPYRELREEQDELDIELIRNIFISKKEKVGALQIKMIMENDYSAVMNHKKIRRLMTKYNLLAKIRRANPYRKMAKATKEHLTCPNLLNREFNQEVPGKVLLTDITYLYYGKGQKAYLSCVKDAATKEIVTYHLSTSLEMDIVYETLNKLKQAVCHEFHPSAILHSDQGFHFTHPLFQRKVKELGITQSMSRKGNCWDNAPMESFFGHFKDLAEYKTCTNLTDVKEEIDRVIEEYNEHRYQWGLKKMAPVQYRDHLLAA
ncbi:MULTISPECIES: IS3 family transposase [unclassified Peribacillus]|uniref:IS3 family transposase n=1 Tax=unclassified Peribacillus TaxID=2675266 RepID=UPI001913FA40|nr:MULTISPECIES: IS3 family transposase [unclassified Peribacillus]MBK5443126.1 IS3 family transposase [Peribacillus sp. TH24]MBK5462132.1 IS3 family transposase [Peribacillus sp. TH27]WMX54679.1 IS3 family transposase [Peribacillus sp. R9-11]